MEWFILFDCFFKIASHKNEKGDLHRTPVFQTSVTLLNLHNNSEVRFHFIDISTRLSKIMFIALASLCTTPDRNNLKEGDIFGLTVSEDSALHGHRGSSSDSKLGGWEHGEPAVQKPARHTSCHLLPPIRPHSLQAGDQLLES